MKYEKEAEKFEVISRCFVFEVCPVEILSNISVMREKFELLGETSRGEKSMKQDVFAIFLFRRFALPQYIGYYTSS